MRTPDEILADFDAAAKGQADLSIRDLLWDVIDDIRDSYRIAMGAYIEDPTADKIQAVVDDYLSTHYGDD